MTDEIYETPSTTPNFQTELAAQLAELMPEVIADGKVDVEKLKELLDGDAADGSERFGLFWPGKKRALRAAQEPTTATLRPDFENSKDWDTTKNVFIEGDNLEVLKILQKHYHAKIKMIYIDPPYNTGKDFVYPDNYKEGLDTYLEWTRQVNEEGKKLSTNADTEGRYHSNWLNMMYPRLKLARNVLTQDGMIFVSIDDNEMPNLRRVMDEVFGESNFVGTIVWKRKRGKDNSAPHVSRSHEYLLVYARSFKEALINRLPMGEETEKAYSNPDNDPRGDYRLVAAWATGQKSGSVYAPNLGEQQIPTRKWVYSQSRLLEYWGDNRLVLKGANTNDGAPNVYLKVFKAATKGQVPDSVWTDAGNAADGADEVKELFGGKLVFSTVKPLKLMQRLVHLGSGGTDIVLDLFAGSGTTGEAVLRQNAEDGNSRRYMQVQLPEPSADGSVARAEGYLDVASISRARMKKAGDEILAEAGRRLPGHAGAFDAGLRSYKLAVTNFSKWNVSSDVDLTELEQHLFDLRESSSADDASADDLLTEVLLKQGYSLTEQIAPVDVAGLDLRSVGGGIVLAYLNEHVKPTLEQLRDVVDEDPARLIVLEDAFQGDDQLKTNLVQLCKSKGLELWTV
ncbi:site-specific DNA-methyltransferase [Kytococcus sedentarius]|uniref:site-specific DNA-methyltransferase n=1 Tax=Kytococcus sedentarius TaxID=1276 RepID=UPI0038510F0F